MARNPGLRPRLVLTAVATTLVVVAAPVGAQPPRDPVGQPPIRILAQPAYFVWVDQAGWHVRWTTPYAAVFSGLVTTDGEIRDLRRAGGGRPSWLSRLSAQRAVFGTLTLGGVEGFDFQTTGSVVTFSPQLNAGLARPGQVYVGRAGRHPAAVPFTLPAQALVQQQDRPLDPSEIWEAQQRAREEFKDR